MQLLLLSAYIKGSFEYVSIYFLYLCWNFTLPSLTYYANICYRAASMGEGSFLFHGPPAKLSIHCPLWPLFKSRGCGFVSSHLLKVKLSTSPGGVKLRELFQTEGRRQETSSSNDRLCEALLQKDFTQIGLPPFDSLNTTPRHSTSETIIIICELVGTFKWKQMKQIRLILEMHKAWIYSPDNIIHFEFQVLI